jgi:hypothetical protein
MTPQTITLIDSSRTVVATAQAVTKDGRLAGEIDLGPMPDPLRRTFEEFEEIVNGQMFSLLDAIESRIAALHFTAVLQDGREVVPEDLQIYPSGKRVSFAVGKESPRSADASGRLASRQREDASQRR